MVHQFISVFRILPTITSIDFSPVMPVLAVIATFAGFRWILASVRIFRGIETLREELMKKGAALTDEEFTDFIVRMLAYYRENRDTIRTMILVCAIGGCCFFVFGIIGSLESIWILQDGVTAALNRYLHFPTILFTLGIPMISLLSSYYFWKFSKIRDVRLEQIEKSENTRKRTLVPNQP